MGKKSIKVAATVKGKKSLIRWFTKPEDHDYPAAASYLSLLYEDAAVTSLVSSLRKAPMTSFKSKDVFRASLLSLLGVSNSHVRKTLKKIEAGEEISPLLLVRSGDGGKVIIADGYHRMCAVYSLDEDAPIPGKIVGLAGPIRGKSTRRKQTRPD